MKIVEIKQRADGNYLITLSNGAELWCYDNEDEMCIDCVISPDWDFINMVDAANRLMAAAHVWKEFHEKFPNFETRDQFAEADDGEWNMYFYLTYEQWEFIYQTYRS